ISQQIIKNIPKHLIEQNGFVGRAVVVLVVCFNLLYDVYFCFMNIFQINNQVPISGLDPHVIKEKKKNIFLMKRSVLELMHYICTTTIVSSLGDIKLVDVYRSIRR
ncbi:hypothetical protein ACJX0J_033883, partial [Zea mays]